MEKINFPWLQNEEAMEPRREALLDPPTKMQKFLKKLKPFLPVLGFLVVLLLLFLTRTSHSTSSNANPPLQALVPLVPIPKGSEIYPETLKQIPIERREFSKPQLLQIARSEDIAKLRGRLRAKKNIPPHHILFWSDIDFKAPATGPVHDDHPQILFPQRSL